jgi:hypothetical protein
MASDENLLWRSVVMYGRWGSNASSPNVTFAMVKTTVPLSAAGHTVSHRCRKLYWRIAGGHAEAYLWKGTVWYHGSRLRRRHPQAIDVQPHSKAH